MAHSPLDQFKIKALYTFHAFGTEINITNSSLYLTLICVIIPLFMIWTLRNRTLIPSKSQLVTESVFNFISDMVKGSIGEKGKGFISLILSIFIFILSANLLGMLPYSFTVTSHISITLALATIIFIFITLYGFYKHGLHFLSLFMPKGTPLWLAPLIILIELFAYLARPVSLSLRLSANMVAGHVLLKVIAGFIIMLSVYLKWVPIPLMVILIGFEFFVAILQAYIFTILSCVYLNDAVNLH